MQSQARVVVVGGGCVGAGILYALARRGWTDLVMLERSYLTAGSTWHAAGLVPIYTRSHAIGRMVRKTIEIYEGLTADTGQEVGWHKCGQLRIANTMDRLDEFKGYMDVAATQNIRAQLVTPDEAKALWPLLENHAMLGGLYHPDDGHIAPADVTQALAKGARDRGAVIHQDTAVTGFTRLPGGWRVHTAKGDITCEHVVSATGNYARQTGAMVGLDLPAIPIVHQYWVTEAVPEVVERKRAGRPEMPILRDEAFAGYLREEGDGLMFGPYERTEQLKLFAEDGVPEWFGADLLPEDFEAVEPNWQAAIELVPALGRAGIKSNVRGPFQMTADELPLAGPAFGLPNFWLAEGVPGGILWGGTLGHHLANWIVDGDPGLDMSELDPRRFGAYATKSWTKARVREAWGTHPDIQYPGRQLHDARRARTGPAYGRLSELGAVWAEQGGWEVAAWYAEGGRIEDGYGFRDTAATAYVAREVQVVRTGVGLVDLTALGKFEVSGPGAAAWLDRILANRLPEPGRIRLAHQLSERGTVLGEYMVARLSDELFYLTSAPQAARLDLDLLTRRLPDDGSVTLREVTAARGCFAIVGPEARELVAALAETELGNAAFPWLTVRTASVGPAPDVRLLRVSRAGELGWELHHPIDSQLALLDELLTAGAPLNLRPVGSHAMESLRLEKSCRAMFRDLTMEDSALESGLDRFVALDKGEFTGRDALRRQAPARRSVTLALEPGEGDAFRHEGVYQGDQLVGRVTSGGYGHHLGQALALAFLPTELASPGTELAVPVLGKRRRATVIPDSPYDPANERPRR